MAVNVKYPRDGPPPETSPIDVDEIVVIGFDWADWLTDIGETEISESVFTVSDGGAVGDGATPVTKKAMSRTPPPPQIADALTTAHIWVTSGAAGQVLEVTNQVAAGTQVLDRTAIVPIKAL